MDRSSTFESLTQARMACLCASAKDRILLAAPGLNRAVAAAIVQARRSIRLVRVVLDCNDDVCRLGYGEIEAIRVLESDGVEVGQCPGLRVGVLIVDGDGWSFTPTPQSVEMEPQSAETPNALRLSTDQQEWVVAALGLNSTTENSSRRDFGAAELGGNPLTSVEVAAVEQRLNLVPPLPFDLQRQVRVFQPYIQFVEMSLKGAAVSRQTVSLPPSLAPLGRDEHVRKRLRTTYNLIDGRSKIDDKPLRDELNRIRKSFTRSVASLDGPVMLRSKQSELESQIADLRGRVTKYTSTLQERLEKEIDASSNALKKALLPLVVRTPPLDLVNGCLGTKVSREEAERWLTFELKKVFPTVDSIVRDIELRLTFKDITYSSLTNPKLQEELQNAFPAVSWERPFKEFAAARASKA